MKILKNCIIRHKFNQCSVFLCRCYFLVFLYQVSLLKFSSFFPAISKRSYFKIITQRIYSFGTHAIEAHTFLKRFTVVFGAGINFAHHIHHFTQRNTPAIIPHRNFIAGNIYIHMAAIAHGVFINTIVNRFFQQYINTIISTAAIAQFSNVHTRPQAYVFFPVEAPDGVVFVSACIFFCHLPQSPKGKFICF